MDVFTEVEGMSGDEGGIKCNEKIFKVRIGPFFICGVI